jgi:hypothetical protein
MKALRILKDQTRKNPLPLTVRVRVRTKNRNQMEKKMMTLVFEMTLPIEHFQSK